MAQQAFSGAGGSGTISINPDELTHIANELMAIANEFESVIAPAIKNINQQNYVTAGKAKKAMKKVSDANDRVLELQDHYSRASSLVFETLNAMIQADQEVGEKIIASLNIGGDKG
ncbi:hypothetical protein ACSMFR_12690 [Listeria aquatica]|uniref:TIGR04197 family type VII secretion effector n=2 Tax=Listeria aquatica TaxID=1494960 RepID=A0A841ZQ83_9LIST|nr:hypothetical protein [Listeria aquatica]MBC1521687.1 hypothetical protein [Listeria aquatica]